MSSTGVNELFATGDMLSTVLKDVFTDVNIYDNDIRLLQYPFISPISSSDAISFYKFYIMDTTFVDKDKCFHLTFVPNNSQDFGFTGHLYVLADSSYTVKKCTMNLQEIGSELCGQYGYYSGVRAIAQWRVGVEDR